MGRAHTPRAAQTQNGGMAANSASRPHAFEILAERSLMPSFREAVLYALTVGAQRHPRYLLGVHRFREEVYLALAALLEADSLARHSASFCTMRTAE